jgi:hypothetical protein
MLAKVYACVAQKKAGPSQAAELYISTWFRKASGVKFRHGFPFRTDHLAGNHWPRV